MQKKLPTASMRYLFSLLLIAIFSTTAMSQELLTLEDVIKLTVENNFDVLIAKNNIQVAKNNNNIGLVGGGAVYRWNCKRWKYRYVTANLHIGW